MTKVSAPSNSLGISLSYRYYLRLELLTEDIIRAFKANTVKLNVWVGDRFPHSFQHQVFKPKLPWETKTAAKHRKKVIWVEKSLPHTPIGHPANGHPMHTARKGLWLQDPPGPGHMQAVDGPHRYLEEKTGLHTSHLFGAELSSFLLDFHQTLCDRVTKHRSQ